MEYGRFFPESVRRAQAYEPPGSWMPALPPGCIRLSAGYPFADSVPSKELAAAAAALVAEERDLPFHYLGSPMMNRLTSWLVERSAARGMALGAGELQVTSGAAQAIDLAARALLGPDDVVAVESPTYMEALEMFRNYTPHIVGFPVDAEGLNTQALEVEVAAGRVRPKLLYTIASFQNPTGVTMSLARRKHLLALAEAYDFLILEDDAYGELAFGEVPTPLKALDRTGRVIYAGSLSKVVGPGLRVGWLAAAPELITAMSLFKKDLEAPFAMAVTAKYLTGIDFGARVEGLRQAYRARRDHLLGALRQHMPAWTSWNEPQGGFFVWIHTPGVDTAALLPEALAAGVAYVPGKYFYFGGDEGREYLRLSFSYLAPEVMEQGVRVLGQVLGARRAQ